MAHGIAQFFSTVCSSSVYSLGYFAGVFGHRPVHQISHEPIIRLLIALNAASAIKSHRTPRKIGLIATRFDYFRPDAKWIEFVLQRLGQPFHCKFSGMVKSAEGESNLSTDGR